MAFNNGDAYQGLWSSRLIIAGILIYTYHTGARPLEYTAMDLRTGEELWTTTFLDNRTISAAQLFYWESTEPRAWPYLWVTVGSDWYAFNPYDAKLRFVITNVPTGTNIVGERGEIYRYKYKSNIWSDDSVEYECINLNGGRFWIKQLSGTFHHLQCIGNHLKWGINNSSTKSMGLEHIHTNGFTWECQSSCCRR